MRFAIIGCGEAGSIRAAAIDSIEGASISVCVDSFIDRAEALGRRYGAEASTNWREALIRDDVDAVVISTANNLHASIAIAAAESGKHIFCERPIARNPAEAEQMLAAAREYRVKMKVGLDRRNHPVSLKARELINEGRLGSIVFVRGRTGRGSYITRPPEWMVDCEISGGGTLIDNGFELLDLCRYFMGEFRSVTGHISALVYPISPCEDNAFAILETADGRAAIIHSSWTDWRDYLSMDISGTEGYLRLDYDNSTVAFGTRPGIARMELEEVFDLSAEQDRSAEIEIKELISAVAEDRDPSGSGFDGQEALILAHAIYRASDEGCAVKV